NSDVLIIGGGAVGICVAHYAAQKGLSVTLLDKLEICSGASYGNAGLIVHSHCIPLAAPSALRGAWKRLFTRDGPIYVKPQLDRDWLAWIWKFYRSCNEQHVRKAMPLLRRLSLESGRLFEVLASRDGAP